MTPGTHGNTFKFNTLSNLTIVKNLLSDDLPAEAPDAVFVGVADDFEGADFAGVLHVGAEACAGVVIPDSVDS